MKPRPAILSRPALAATLLAAACTAHSAVPATPLPLPPPPATPADQPLQRQTGMVVIEREHGQKIIVRSLEPDSLVGGDRYEFGQLDADGDGFVERGEAGAVDRYLLRAFDQLDANRDGRLDRDELTGWIL
ncbi:hypothetical protein [Pseudoxanthomonas suwonensis]|uniref:hypothetical protein n=1 Tax=Pseudoxanthomonas suwonensis TaxID=314722 RepID=UPI0004B22548|nr:hypothetical protein [Pseudoxanthomonas suwonensis]